MKVAIIIPTMNRPDFVLRHFEFYELTDSPHPIYVLDSSNEENAEKIKNEIKKCKKLNIVYQWASPGKDHLHSLLPLVKERYCIQIGDDDLIIPKTISECADFLENHSDYATCAGKQVNVRFQREDYNNPFGLIERQTRPFGKSFEDEDLLLRIKNFWSDPNFICFAVTRTEIEKKIRNVTNHFSFLEHLTEFVIWSVLIISGKAKILDRIGYIMQISDNRGNFKNNLTLDFMLDSSTREKWDICEDGVSQILCECGVPQEETHKIARWIFTIYLARQLFRESGSHSNVHPKRIASKVNPYQKVRNYISRHDYIKKIIYKIKPSMSGTGQKSTDLNDFKVVKDFLEKNGAG